MLYLADHLQSGHATACFGGNQLLPGLIDLSPLDMGHANDLHISTACGPPRSFRHASTCPRLDHPASGNIPATPRTCIRRASPKLRAFRFRYGSGVQHLNLAAEIYSLARSSERMTGHRHHHSYQHLTMSSFVAKFLSRPAALSPIGFRPFSPPFSGFFSAFGHPTISLSDSRNN